MTNSESLEFLTLSSTFFSNYQNEMTERLKGLYLGAVGESRYVTAWMTGVALENSKHSHQKIEQFKVGAAASNLEPATGSWFNPFSWNWGRFLPEKLKFASATEPTPKAELDLSSEVARAAEYLLRAEEVLGKSLVNGEKGSTYIPVAAHKTEHERTKTLYNEILSIQRKFPAVFEDAKQRKTWLTDELAQGNDLVLARVTAYGLSDRSLYPFESSMSKDAIEQRGAKAAKELKELAKSFLNPTARELTLVKTTQKLTGSSAIDQPGSTDIHKEHMPAGINNVLTQFGDFAKSRTARQLTFKEVDPQLKMEFPTPKTKLV